MIFRCNSFLAEWVIRSITFHNNYTVKYNSLLVEWVIYNHRRQSLQYNSLYILRELYEPLWQINTCSVTLSKLHEWHSRLLSSIITKCYSILAEGVTHNQLHSHHLSSSVTNGYSILSEGVAQVIINFENKLYKHY